MKALHAISIIICLLVIQACDKIENSRIPYSYVFLELNLSYEDRALKDPLAYKVYTENQYNGRKVGFGGVLVFRGVERDVYGSFLYAFDTACPYEAKNNINVTIDNEYYAVCLTCGSKYDIMNGWGLPVEGPSLSNMRVNRLKKYTVSEYSSGVGEKAQITP